MGLLVAFLLVIAIVGTLFYVLIIQRAVPGIVEQRVGVLEALPADVGKWKPDLDSEEGRAALQRGERREVRLYHNPNDAEKLVRQVRYRNGANEIIRAEKDEVIKRRRLKR